MTQAMQLRYMAQANKVAHPEDATHIAIQSGPWSDPSTWSCNEVPQDEEFALIPDHITVKYDLAKLTDAGYLRRLGKGRGTVYERVR